MGSSLLLPPPSHPSPPPLSFPPSHPSPPLPSSPPSRPSPPLPSSSSLTLPPLPPLTLSFLPPHPSPPLPPPPPPPPQPLSSPYQLRLGLARLGGPPSPLPPPPPPPSLLPCSGWASSPPPPRLCFVKLERHQILHREEFDVFQASQSRVVEEEVKKPTQSKAGGKEVEEVVEGEKEALQASPSRAEVDKEKTEAEEEAEEEEEEVAKDGEEGKKESEEEGEEESKKKKKEEV